MNEAQQKHGAWIARYLKEQIHDTLLSRGKKYNGDDFEDPFKQVKETAQLTFGEVNEETLDHSFRHLINHKVTRLANNRADFSDESRLETLRDIIGYTTLYAEWLDHLKTPTDVPTVESPVEPQGPIKAFKKYLLGKDTD